MVSVWNVEAQLCCASACQCGDTIEKSQAPDDGRINVRNMLSIEEVK